MQVANHLNIPAMALFAGHDQRRDPHYGHPRRQRLEKDQRVGESMKIQVCRLAIALAIASPLAVAATAKTFAAPINGISIAVPAVKTDVRYRAYWDYPYASYLGYPAYYYYGYPEYWTYSPYWTYPRYYGYGWW
jgi:hypothetical protein